LYNSVGMKQYACHSFGAYPFDHCTVDIAAISPKTFFRQYLYGQ